MLDTPNFLTQLSGEIFLSDGGLETTLIFENGIDLPNFAAFPLIGDNEGCAALKAYYRRHAAVAERYGRGFVFESPTWRASADWGRKLGYDAAALRRVNETAIDLIAGVQAEFPKLKSVLSGNIGPRGDGYDPGELMTPAEAERFHAAQVDTFAKTQADLITAVTITNAPEAIGIINAATCADRPAVIAFTVETDGRLPTGQQLGEAIEEVDDATGSAAAYFMLNCAHPDHFTETLRAGGTWLRRICGIRANASRLSHAELDEATELDGGDPAETGADYAELRRLLPHLVVLGGCCGTDHRHIDAIGRACQNSEAA